MLNQISTREPIWVVEDNIAYIVYTMEIYFIVVLYLDEWLSHDACTILYYVVHVYIWL